jgi:hydroxylamine dehydrogenase
LTSTACVPSTYVTWYGLAEMQKDLVEIKADAAAMIRETGHKK